MAGNSLIAKLQNAEFGENLYAEWIDWRPAPCCGRDLSRRAVHTWRPVNDVNVDHNWNLTGVYIGGIFLVRLAHISQAGEKLVSPPEDKFMFDSQYRNVFTWMGNSSVPSGSADWYMDTDIGDTQSLNLNRYRFTNALTKEVLVAGPESLAYSKERRRVFTNSGPKNDTTATKSHLWNVLVVG